MRVWAGIAILLFGKLTQRTTLLNQDRPTAAAISGDGRLLAYAIIDGIFLKSLPSDQLNVRNGPRDFVVDHLAWLADNRALIVGGFSEETSQASLWVLPLAGGKVQELREDARIARLDRGHVMFNQYYGEFHIRELTLDGRPSYPHVWTMDS